MDGVKLFALYKNFQRLILRRSLHHDTHKFKIHAPDSLHDIEIYQVQYYEMSVTYAQFTVNE